MSEQIKPKSPADCIDESDAIALRRDYVSKGNWRLSTDGYRVSITEQLMGEPPRQSITLTPAMLNYLIKWYQKKQ